MPLTVNIIKRLQGFTLNVSLTAEAGVTALLGASEYGAVAEALSSAADDPAVGEVAARLAAAERPVILAGFEADRAFSIPVAGLEDMAPANSWVVAPRTRTPIFPGLNYSFLKISESLPLFDLWPLRYATSYEFVPGPNCPFPLRIGDPQFQDCYRAVGDFPEVNIGPKWLGTRILTAFGAGLAPIF